MSGRVTAGIGRPAHWTGHRAGCRVILERVSAVRRRPFARSPPTDRAAARRRPVPLADAASLPARDPYRRPWPGREITSGGVTLHVRETPGPDGAPAVYVHGLSGSATNWTDLAALLCTRAAGTAVDLPGFGLSRPLASRDYTPAGHADALLCFLAGRGRPVHLLGNSLGGAVALSVAARRPELVRTLTLVSPAMPDRRPDPRRVSDPRLLLALLPRHRRAGPGRAGRDGPADPGRAGDRGCASATRACVPEHRLAEAAAEIEARGRPGVGPGGGQPDRAGHVRQLVPPRAVAAGRPGCRRRRWSSGASGTGWSRRGWPRAPRGRCAGRLLMLPGVGHVAQIEAPDAVARAVAGMWDAVADRQAGPSGEEWRRPRRCRQGRPTPTSTSRSLHHGATAAGGAGRRADQGRGGPLQPAPDHPGRRDGRSEAAEEREGAGGRRRWAGQPGAAVPGRGRGGHAGHRRVRRGRRVQPAAPGHPRPVRHRPAQGRVGARLDPRDQPVRRGPACTRCGWTRPTRWTSSATTT